MSRMYLRAMIPKAQANQNQVSQRKTLLKEYIFKPSGLLSDLIQLSFNLPQRLIQVHQVVLATEQILPNSLKRQSRAVLLSRTTLARES